MLDITDSELSAKENRDVFQSLLYVLLLITRFILFLCNVCFCFFISSFCAFVVNVIIDISNDFFNSDFSSGGCSSNDGG
ncbi:MAG: hypothetical protein IJK67_04660 [Bacilli bacterium]|nr:hypothetical protein [Bacilli bacterium]